MKYILIDNIGDGNYKLGAVVDDDIDGNSKR